MKSDNQNKIGARRTSAFARIEKMHPLRMVLYLFLIGISILFGVLVTGFFSTEATVFRQQHIPFPRFFSVSTVLLIFSSFTLSKVPALYRADNLPGMARSVLFTLLLGFAFMLCQLMGWYELAYYGVYVQGKIYGSYIYLISALHMLHLLVGILFLSLLYFKTRFAASDAIRTLVFIRDPYRKIQLDVITLFWHFLDGLWGLLFLIFLFWF